MKSIANGCTNNPPRLDDPTPWLGFAEGEPAKLYTVLPPVLLTSLTRVFGAHRWWDSQGVG